MIIGYNRSCSHHFSFAASSFPKSLQLVGIKLQGGMRKSGHRFFDSIPLKTLGIDHNRDLKPGL